MKHPLTDQGVVSVLARRSRQTDRGFTDTLRPQADRGSRAEVFNPASERHLKPQVRCWCERHIVMSTWQRIYDGAGETCGSPNCDPKENR